MAELRVLICKNCVESNRQRDFYLAKSQNLERKLEDHNREVANIEKFLEVAQQTVALMKKRLSRYESSEIQENSVVVQTGINTLEAWQHVFPNDEPEGPENSSNEIEILEHHEIGLNLEIDSFIPNGTSMTDADQSASRDPDTHNAPLVMDEMDAPENEDRNGPSAGTEERVVLRESQKEENTGRKRSYYQKCRWDVEDEGTSTGTPRMCGKVFTVDRLVPHILEEHGGQETLVCLWRDCKVYRVPFKDADQLESHVHGHRLNMMYRCLQNGCGKLFECRRELQEHGALHPRGSNPRKPEYPCPHEGCSRTFKEMSMVQSHVKSHMSHPCKDPGCPKVYGTEQKMIRHHQINHLGIKEFECPYEKCGVWFTEKSHLNKHVNLLHLNQKPFRCDYPGCGKAFKYLPTYQTHRKTHGALETVNKSRNK